jgi:uncharacterized protein (UPF0212 family)
MSTVRKEVAEMMRIGIGVPWLVLRHIELATSMEQRLAQLVAMLEERLSGVPAPAGLHVCPECGSQLVQSVLQGETLSVWHQRVWRRCPECDWERDAVHVEAEADAFDQELTRGAEALRKELENREREGLEDMADVFGRALAEDLITADDFARQGRIPVLTIPGSPGHGQEIDGRPALRARSVGLPLGSRTAR